MWKAAILALLVAAVALEVSLSEGDKDHLIGQVRATLTRISRVTRETVRHARAFVVDAFKERSDGDVRLMSFRIGEVEQESGGVWGRRGGGGGASLLGVLVVNVFDGSLLSPEDFMSVGSAEDVVVVAESCREALAVIMYINPNVEEEWVGAETVQQFLSHLDLMDAIDLFEVISSCSYVIYALDREGE